MAPFRPLDVAILFNKQNNTALSEDLKSASQEPVGRWFKQNKKDL